MQKVLVADDDQVLRKLLRFYLIHWGYEVREATDGKDALKQLDNENFDFLLLDILMPRKNGWRY